MIKTPEEGYELTQPASAICEKLRSEYAENLDALIASCQIVATHSATVTAANGYWRDK